MQVYCSRHCDSAFPRCNVWIGLSALFDLRPAQLVSRLLASRAKSNWRHYPSSRVGRSLLRPDWRLSVWVTITWPRKEGFCGVHCQPFSRNGFRLGSYSGDEIRNGIFLSLVVWDCGYRCWSFSIVLCWRFVLSLVIGTKKMSFWEYTVKYTVEWTVVLNH